MLNSQTNNLPISNPMSQQQADFIALILRLGLAAVFIIGGTSKLNLLLDSATHDAMVANYMSTSGYINSVFQDFLFTGFLENMLSPSSFLTLLSSFELFSGLALTVGFLVRPLSLIYAFLLWSFVIALPTMTVPGVEFTDKTYTSPAIFVQIRDICLSGMMFALFNLGAGSYSVDKKFFSQDIIIQKDTVALLLRLSLGSVFLVAGFFSEFANIQSFKVYPLILIVISLGLLFGSSKIVKIAGIATIIVMCWFIINKFNVDNTLIKNLNGFKREFALLAAGAALVSLGAGRLFTLQDIIDRVKKSVQLYLPKRSH